jgi:hypothetical protein
VRVAATGEAQPGWALSTRDTTPPSPSAREEDLGGPRLCAGQGSSQSSSRRSANRDDERIEAEAGCFALAPKGVPHAFLVRSARAEFLITYGPAGMEGFFAEVGLPVVSGEAKPAPMASDPRSSLERPQPTGSR